MKMTQDEKYMKAAIREAKKAYALDEVPIGCVIVQDGTIIAIGYNIIYDTTKKAKIFL